MNGFEYLAAYYDEFVGADYDKIVGYIHRIVQEHSPKAVYGVDLGCGSGTLTLRLADLGYDMIGVDGSEDMLSKAMEKKPIDSSVLFLQQDLEELDLYGPADFMVSTLDCLNYLEGPREFLRRCALFLKSGGLLIFDYNTLYKYETILNGQNFVYETEDTFCVWENEFEDNRMFYDLTYFVRDGAHYERFEDHQMQTYFSPEEVEGWLRDFGFEILKIEDDYSACPVNEKTQRRVVTARKKG